MMKNKLMNMVKLTLASTILFASLSVTASAAQPIKRVGTPDIQVLIDARKIKLTDAKPYANADQRVMVPVRVVSEGLGAKVDWNQSENKVTITKGEKVIQLVANQQNAIVNGKTVQFDTKMTVKQQRVYVPLRFVSEALGQSVTWDSVSQWVWIGKQDIPTREDAGVKNVPIENIEKYFADKPYLLTDSFDVKYSEATIYKAEQFPISLPVITSNEFIVYEVFPAKQGDYDVIGVRYKGHLGKINIVLDHFKGVRTRNAMAEETVKHADGTKTSYFPVVFKGDLLDDIQNYLDLKISDLKYITFRGSFSEIQLLEMK